MKNEKFAEGTRLGVTPRDAACHKDFMRSLNVKSTLMSFNAKPALAVGDH